MQHRPVADIERGAVPVAWAGSLFGAYTGDVYRDVMPAGLSIAEIVARIPNLPADFDRHGVVCLNGEPVDRRYWRSIRPRVNGPIPVAVTLHVPAGRGGGARGGGGGGKNILAIVAAIALIALTSWIGGGGLAAAGILGEAFAAGATGARLLAAGVGLIGSLAIQALSPPPAAQAQGAPATAEQPGSASASGNQIGRGNTLPAVVGTHRIYPSHITPPWVEIDGEDEIVRAAFGLAGPHLLEDIEVAGVPIDGAEDIEVETREGWEDDAALTLVTRQAYTMAPGPELSGYDFATPTGEATNTRRLVDQETPSNSAPKWQRVVTREAPDQVQMHIGFPQGLRVSMTDPDESMPVRYGYLPVRFRIRLKGTSTWSNLPEVHFRGLGDSKTGGGDTLFRQSVDLIWQEGHVDAFGDQAKSVKNAVFAYRTVPGQSSTPSDPGWTAHSHFDPGTGTVNRVGGSTPAAPGTTRLRNISLHDDRVKIYLDPATFPKGVYEIEIKRGALVRPGSDAWNPTAYTYSGSVWNLFGWRTSGSFSYALRESPNQYDTAILLRVVSIWDELPIAAGAGVALVAIEARNRAVDQVSVLASGYVQDWNGVDAWDEWTTTSNPAPHFRQVLAGPLNRRPLAAGQIDDESILAWRAECIGRGYEADAILDGRSVADALNLIAGCGYARPFKSELWGVAYERSRSTEDLVQVFSPRNMADFRWTRAFADLPDHFIATFRDREANYETREIIVYADGYNAGNAELPEAVDYLGPVTEDAVRRRGRYDHRQARLRSVIFTGRASAEHIVCRRGDHVGLQHDTLSRQSGSARIKEVLKSGSDVTGLRLDGVIPAGEGGDFFDFSNLFSVDDIFADEPIGVAIRLKDGSTLVKRLASFDDAEQDEVDFQTGFADPGADLAEDCLVVSGPIGLEYRSAIVADIAPGEDLTATVAFVDAAPGVLGIGLLDGTVPAASDMVGALSMVRSIGAAIDAEAVIEGDFSTSVLLATLPAVSGLAANLAVVRPVTTTIVAESGVEATIRKPPTLIQIGEATGDDDIGTFAFPSAGIAIVVASGFTGLAAGTLAAVTIGDAPADIVSANGIFMTGIAWREIEAGEHAINVQFSHNSLLSRSYIMLLTGAGSPVPIDSDAVAFNSAGGTTSLSLTLTMTGSSIAIFGHAHNNANDESWDGAAAIDHDEPSGRSFGIAATNEAGEVEVSWSANAVASLVGIVFSGG